MHRVSSPPSRPKTRRLLPVPAPNRRLSSPSTTPVAYRAIATSPPRLRTPSRRLRPLLHLLPAARGRSKAPPSPPPRAMKTIRESLHRIAPDLSLQRARLPTAKSIPWTTSVEVDLPTSIWPLQTPRRRPRWKKRPIPTARTPPKTRKPSLKGPRAV